MKKSDLVKYIKEEMKFVQFNEDEMRMDIDERINDRALLMHQ